MPRRAIEHGAAIRRHGYMRRTGGTSSLCEHLLTAKPSLTSAREFYAFALSHFLGWLFALAVYPLVYAYLNGLGTRLLAVNEIRILAVVLAVLLTFIVLTMFLFFRRLFIGGQAGATTGREIAAYLATHAVGLILLFNIAPSIYQMLSRMSLSRHFMLASAIMNTIEFSLVFALFVLLRRTLAKHEVNEGGVGL